jgi:hypothetical protein
MATYYWVGGTGTWNNVNTNNWSLTSGVIAPAGPPTNADTVIFNANSGTAAIVTVTSTAVSLSTTINKADINLSLSGSPTLCTAAGTCTLTAGTLSLNNYTLTTGIFSSSNSNTRSIAFGTSGKIVANGTNTTVVSFATSTNFSYTGTSRIEVTGNPSTGTRTISGPTYTTGTEAKALNIYITNGSDTITFGTNNRYYRTIDLTGFTGTIISGSDFTLFGDLVIPSGVTYGATAASGLIFASTNATPRTITTPGRTFNCPLNFNGVGGTWAFQNALTMASTKALTLTNGTLQLQSGTTNTVGSFVTPGSNQIYLQATTPGVQATISAASGTNNAYNITLRDSNATGGAVWRATNSSGTVDGGNNSGWIYLSWAIINNSQTPSWANITQP